MAAEQTIGGGKAEPVGRREVEAGADQVLAAHLLEEVSAREDVTCPRRVCRVAHPVELDFAQALAADG